MAQAADIKINVEVGPYLAALARPGDTILIGFDRTLSDDELDQLRESFQGFTDTTGVHIAFVEHVTSMVVAKGSEVEPLNRTEVRVSEGGTVTLEGYDVEGER